MNNNWECNKCGQINALTDRYCVKCGTENPNMIQVSLLKVFGERQQIIVSYLPKFFRITSIIAIIGFIVTLTIQILTEQIINKRISILTLQPNLASIIAIFLTIFSNAVIWVFVLWSLTFVPFIATRAHRSSKLSYTNVVTRPFRWVQLYASTFLPMTIFAVAWSSVNLPERSLLLQIVSVHDLVMVAGGTLIVIISLFIINKLVPARLVAIKLSLLSSMLYASLFLTYGYGYGAASHAMVFGILIYLTFFYGHIEEIGRKLSVYDIDPRVADELDSIANRYQELSVTRDETALKAEEHTAEKSRRALELEILKTEGDEILDRQLAETQKMKLDLYRQMHEKTLGIIQQKLKFLNQGFEIYMKELSKKIDGSLPDQLKQIQRDADSATPRELKKYIERCMRDVNTFMAGMPESIEDLRHQLDKITTELDAATRHLTYESEDKK